MLGDFPDTTQDHQPQLTTRSDGSLLVDGDYQFDEVIEFLEISEPDDFKEIKQNITTVGGFIMYMLNKVPVTGDHINLDNKKLYKYSWIASSVSSIVGFGGSSAIALKSHFWIRKIPFQLKLLIFP